MKLKSMQNMIARTSLVCLVMLSALANAHAALFEDDEARKAILELRQKVENNRLTVEQYKSANATETSALSNSLLGLLRQIELLRGELANLRGMNEQLAKNLAELQRQQKDDSQSISDRIGKIEPLTVTVDGVAFMAEPNERRAFDAALQVFKSGNFLAAQHHFVDFIEHYPSSGYLASAFFWLGNAQYATRDYKEAIINFRALVAKSPGHWRTPEAILSIANCQLELKDSRGARKTLSDLIHNYPKSEAAVAAKERLALLK